MRRLLSNRHSWHTRFDHYCAGQIWGTGIALRRRPRSGLYWRHPRSGRSIDCRPERDYGGGSGISNRYATAPGRRIRATGCHAVALSIVLSLTVTNLDVTSAYGDEDLEQTALRGK